EEVGTAVGSAEALDGGAQGAAPVAHDGDGVESWPEARGDSPEERGQCGRVVVDREQVAGRGEPEWPPPKGGASKAVAPFGPAGQAGEVGVGQPAPVGNEGGRAQPPGSRFGEPQAADPAPVQVGE